jgi:hypothetical protein
MDAPGEIPGSIHASLVIEFSQQIFSV